MYADQFVSQLVAERPPELRRFTSWRGRLRPPPVKRARPAEFVWVTGSPWTLHYVRIPVRAR